MLFEKVEAYTQNRNSPCMIYLLKGYNLQVQRTKKGGRLFFWIISYLVM